MGKIIEIRWHGRGGQGSFTASKLLGEAASLHGGKYALAFPSFGPERRGAPVLAFTKIADKKIQDRSEVKQCDYIVVLDETLFNEAFLYDLKPEGRIIINTGTPEKYKHIDGNKLSLINASDLAQTVLSRPVTNTVMIGALAGATAVISLQSLLAAATNYFKGELLVKNMEAIKQAFEYSKNQEQI
ncbi:MAG: 2-oxoacid:acceptor oxidoreductase family protein [Dysgonamonadaceae bacterium]|jgi:pyruvate ferredoxin oxidoreductase gamma subunit|nr:2-oxoacid:acceptor oxidoreductase family protein [Dysgonamonadaceae bacterium]